MVYAVKPIIILRRALKRNPASPAVYEYIGHPVSVLTGKALRIICIATGSPRPSISWNKNGQAVVPDRRRIQILRSDGSLVIRLIRETDAGEYTCLASNLIGSHSISSVVDVVGEKI